MCIRDRTPAADAEVKEAEKTPEVEVPGVDEKDIETVEEETGLTEQTIEASVDTEDVYKRQELWFCDS